MNYYRLERWEHYYVYCEKIAHVARTNQARRTPLLSVEKKIPSGENHRAISNRHTNPVILLLNNLQNFVRPTAAAKSELVLAAREANATRLPPSIISLFCEFSFQAIKAVISPAF